MTKSGIEMQEEAAAIIEAAEAKLFAKPKKVAKKKAVKSKTK